LQAAQAEKNTSQKKDDPQTVDEERGIDRRNMKHADGLGDGKKNAKGKSETRGNLVSQAGTRAMKLAGEKS